MAVTSATTLEPRNSFPLRLVPRWPVTRTVLLMVLSFSPGPALVHASGGGRCRKFCIRIVFAVVQSVVESLRFVLKLDALDADHGFVCANSIAEVEIFIGIENVVARLEQFRILVFADSDLLLDIVE